MKNNKKYFHYFEKQEEDSFEKWKKLLKLKINEPGRFQNQERNKWKEILMNIQVVSFKKI